MTASAPAPVSRSQPRAQSGVDEWPLRSYLELGALPSAVPCARLHAKQVLWEWGLSDFSDKAELVLSELLTNAIQASRSDDHVLPVYVWLSSDRSGLLIQVKDTIDRPPTRTHADDQDESGRGLLIVDAVSMQWGWHATEDQSGKVVWALIELKYALQCVLISQVGQP
ncbi:MAG TPA: ATP-binding protein [Streptosporangiaceae bacterium]|nr:ATP-binding protein [Streptosporangiaceae bacterium]